MADWIQRWWKLSIGPIGACCTYVLLAEHSPAIRYTAAVATLMALWWIVEAIDVAVTALLPLVLFPLFDIVDIKSAAAPYAHPVIFLFMGGFMIAKTMERWQLHRRLALLLIRAVGNDPTHIVAGFMATSAFFSMWISNTATVVMLIPIAISVIDAIPQQQNTPGQHSNFSKALLLGIAYAASIGGVSTLIGSPPNALYAAFMQQEYQTPIGFTDWMQLALPVAMIFLPVCWLLLTRVLFPIRTRKIPGMLELINQELHTLGPMNSAEKRTLTIFIGTAALWIFRPLIPLPLNDSSVAILGAVLMFLMPSGAEKYPRLLNWASAQSIPWGILLLFGGGLSLAVGLSQSGVTTLIGDTVSNWNNISPIIFMLAVVGLIIFLTEMMSNTATVAMFLPILAALATSQGIPPSFILLPASCAASFAFMMPVATPPNAIVFSAGRLRMADMARSGIILNMLGIALLTAYFGWVL